MRGVVFAALVSASACIGGCPGSDSGPRNGVDRVLYFSDVDFKSDEAMLHLEAGALKTSIPVKFTTKP